MHISVSNTLTVTEPTDEMLIWCNKNLSIPNPEYAKKARMNFWLGNTPRVLHLYETRGDELVLPFGVLRMLPKEVTDNADRALRQERYPFEFYRFRRHSVRFRI